MTYWIWKYTSNIKKPYILIKNLVSGNTRLLSLKLWAPTPQNGQIHSNDSSHVADEVFERVWPFCGVGP